MSLLLVARFHSGTGPVWARCSVPPVLACSFPHPVLYGSETAKHVGSDRIGPQPVGDAGEPGSWPRSGSSRSVFGLQLGPWPPGFRGTVLRTCPRVWRHTDSSTPAVAAVSRASNCDLRGTGRPKQICVTHTRGAGPPDWLDLGHSGLDSVAKSSCSGSSLRGWPARRGWPRLLTPSTTASGAVGPGPI